MPKRRGASARSAWVAQRAIRTLPISSNSHSIPGSCNPALVTTARMASGARCSGSGAIESWKRLPCDATRRQGGDEVGFRYERQGHHEVRDSDDHASRQALLLQQRIDESVRIAALRDQEVVHRTKGVQRRATGERMTLAGGDDELVFVDFPRCEAGGHLVDGQHGNVE